MDENFEATEDFIARKFGEDDEHSSEDASASQSNAESSSQASPVKSPGKGLPKVCDLCGKQVTNLSQHRKHHKEKITCKVCNRPVRKAVSHRHVCNLKFYGCICGARFALKSEIEGHLRTMRKKEIWERKHDFQCCRCLKQLAKVDDLEGHLSSEHKIFICLLCYKNFPNEGSLWEHRENHHRELITCSVCSLILPSKESLTHHMKFIHVVDGNVTCSLCFCIFSTKEELKCHMEDVHENTKGFTCKFCGKVRFRADSLTRHMINHVDEKPFQCAFCYSSFKLPRELRKHNSAHKEFMIKCPSCESFHLNQQELSLHLKRHPSHRKMTGIAGSP